VKMPLEINGEAPLAMKIGLGEGLCKTENSFAKLIFEKGF